MAASRRRANPLGLIGMGLMALGVVGLVLGLLQPWRTCGDDIIAAACPATGTELGVMIVGLAGFVVMFFALRRS